MRGCCLNYATSLGNFFWWWHENHSYIKKKSRKKKKAPPPPSLTRPLKYYWAELLGLGIITKAQSEAHAAFLISHFLFEEQMNYIWNFKFET